MFNTYLRTALRGNQVALKSFKFSTLKPIPYTQFRLNSIMSENQFYRIDTPVIPVDAEKAFQGLKSKEKLYAHYLSKASWYGSLVVLFQTSPESPLIFVIFRKLFSKQSLDSLKSLALSPKVGLTDQEWKNFLVYAAAFYSNMGNYRGFGDTKFIPNVPMELFKKLVINSVAYKDSAKELDFCMDNCIDRMYCVKNKCSLAFAPDGMTTYFSSNMTQDDSHVVSDFLKTNGIEAYNTRVYKSSDRDFVIRFASILDNDSEEDSAYMKGLQSAQGKFGEYNFRMERGDYSLILRTVNDYLKKAKENALNENESNMINEYIRHFISGDLHHHKSGSRFWIKDKGPVVETYIGFIESYRDPSGQRGEFEGFVAIVNREMSKKFESLVDNAPELLKILPWGKDFEKDTFLKPDFTSLDVLTFSGSGIPSGINIPNYDDIRQNEGFKNVSLGNVIQGIFREPSPKFLDEEDGVLLSKYSLAAFEVQVGLHELLGHGSGKIFKADVDGKLNFNSDKVMNWKTKSPVNQWYLPGETYVSKFGSLSSSYEECRAEAVGLYLSLEDDVLRIFGINDPQEREYIVYVNWLCMVQKGIESLKMYDPANKRWLQAHAQARFVITRFLYEKVKGFVKISIIDVEEDGKIVQDLRISMDKKLESIRGSARDAIKELLLNLQLWKSTGDVKSAMDFFGHYSDIGTADWDVDLYRQIVIARERPRRMLVLASTHIDDSSQVQYRNHKSSHEGIIESFQDHFSDNAQDFENDLITLWKADSGKMF